MPQKNNGDWQRKNNMKYKHYREILKKVDNFQKKDISFMIEQCDGSRATHEIGLSQVYRGEKLHSENGPAMVCLIHMGTSAERFQNHYFLNGIEFKKSVWQKQVKSGKIQSERVERNLHNILRQNGLK